MEVITAVCCCSSCPVVDVMLFFSLLFSGFQFVLGIEVQCVKMVQERRSWEENPFPAKNGILDQARKHKNVNS